MFWNFQGGSYEEFRSLSLQFWRAARASFWIFAGRLTSRRCAVDGRAARYLELKKHYIGLLTWIELPGFVVIECIFDVLFNELLANGINRSWANEDCTARITIVSVMLRFHLECVSHLGLKCWHGAGHYLRRSLKLYAVCEYYDCLKVERLLRMFWIVPWPNGPCIPAQLGGPQP